MNKQIIDLTRQFSEIEKEIIKEFFVAVSGDKLEITSNSVGCQSYRMTVGLKEIDFDLCSDGVEREILVTAKNIKPDMHEINGEPITNPSELKNYLQSLIKKAK